MNNSKTPWQKALYLHQDYPDNYTDPDIFLQDLQTRIKYVSIIDALSGATLLLEEFCTVIAFVLIYVYLINEWVEPEYILKWSGACTFSGFVLYRTPVQIPKTFGSDLRTLLIFMVFGHLFSPVLHTLTDTISTDTIYTMTFLMMLVHLIFFDYGVNAATVSNSLSTSAAIFASICLASRLSSAFHAFILLAVAIQLFVLFPMFRRNIQQNIALAIKIGLFAIDVYYLYHSSKLFLTMFLISVFFVNVVCPFLFVKYQKYKSNIYGPWDEAVVDIKEK